MSFDNKLIFKILILILNIFVTKTSLSQNFIDYSIDASLLTETDQIIIKQRISFSNQDNSLDKIYLNDWANSYSSSKSPLADRLLRSIQEVFIYLQNQNEDVV